MRGRVIKEFHYAHDGVNPERQRVGTEREFRDDVVEALKAAGLISVAEDGKRRRRPKGRP